VETKQQMLEEFSVESTMRRIKNNYRESSESWMDKFEDSLLDD
jgi:hypothetical protein